MTLPLFPVTGVGSLPRSKSVLKALRQKQKGEVALEEFDRIADEAVLAALRLQDEAGLDIVSDGEQRRDNFYSFIAERVAGIRLMTLAEMLDYVDDKAAFERLLNALDVPAFALKNPVVVGRLARPAAVGSERLSLSPAAHGQTDQSDVARAVSVDSFDVGEKPLGRVLSR